MTFNELHKEYEKMCDSQACYACKYNGNFPCGLQFGYEQGREDMKENVAKSMQRILDDEKRWSYEQGKKDAIARDYNTILIYEDAIRNMLLDTSQENSLFDWVDLNGKLNAIAHIKHLIYDLET